LLDEIREAGADDDTQELINSVGDRLHRWCHQSRWIRTRESGSGAAQPPPANGTHPAADRPVSPA
jgi:hypothetical protein